MQPFAMTPEKRNTYWLVSWTLVLLASASVYIGSLGGSLVWDDYYFVKGEGIGGGDSLLHCFTKPFLWHYFRPLVSVSLYIDRHFFGNNPFGYHVENIILHTITSALVMGMLLEAYNRKRVALAGGMLFAVQPVQVGAVAWMGGRTDSLCALWVSAFGYLLIRAARNTGDRRSFCTAGAVLCYAAALFTKEQAILLILLVPLAFHSFPPRRGVNLPSTGIWSSAPFIVPIALFFALGWFLGMPRTHGPVTGLGDLLTQFFRSLFYYFLLFLAPSPRWMHTMSLGNFERSGAWTIAAGVLCLIIAIVACIIVTRRSKEASWFLAMTILACLPVSNIVPLAYILVAPYRVGIGGPAAACLMAIGIMSLPAVPFGNRLFTKVSAPVAILAILTLWHGSLTAWAASLWRSDEVVFSTFVRYDPDAVVARYTLAYIYLAEEKDDKAAEQFTTMLWLIYRSNDWKSPERAAWRLMHDKTVYKRAQQNQGSLEDPRQWVAGIYSQAGYAKLRLVQYNKASPLFDAGVAVDPEDPNCLAGKGWCIYETEDKKLGEELIRRAINLDTTKGYIHAYLGRVYADRGDWSNACVEYRLWTQGDADSSSAPLALARSLRQFGDVRGAKSAIDDGLKRFPNDKEMLDEKSSLDHDIVEEGQ